MHEMICKVPEKLLIYPRFPNLALRSRRDSPADFLSPHDGRSMSTAGLPPTGTLPPGEPRLFRARLSSWIGGLKAGPLLLKNWMLFRIVVLCRIHFVACFFAPFRFGFANFSHHANIRLILVHNLINHSNFLLSLFVFPLERFTQRNVPMSVRRNLQAFSPPKCSGAGGQ